MKKRLVLISLVVLIAFAAGGCSNNSQTEPVKMSDKKLNSELKSMAESALYPNLYATDKKLCTLTGNVESKDITPEWNEGIALFNITDNKVVCAYNVFNRRFPASTTKLMTIYSAVNGNKPIDTTVTCNGDITNIDSASSVANLQVGDTLTLNDLFYGTMLPSGNDAAIALADGVYGTVDKTVSKMNEYAIKLGMTGTHYVNVNGLQDENHYTTLYDMYLIFRECLTDDTLIDIMKTTSYTAKVNRGGAVTELTWTNTNEYFTDEVNPPANVSIVCGKTGTTNEAGACLIQVVKTNKDKLYIAMIMGATSHSSLYQQMNQLLTLCQ